LYISAGEGAVAHPNLDLTPGNFGYRFKKERSVAFKIRQNVFSGGVPPRTLLRQLMTLPTPSRLGTRHPFPYPSHSTPPASRFCRLRRSPSATRYISNCNQARFYVTASGGAIAHLNLDLQKGAFSRLQNTPKCVSCRTPLRELMTIHNP